MTKTLIFAKAPIAGFAKTRLIPLLGAEGAANLARRMLDSTLASVVSAQIGPVELCVTPDSEHPAWQEISIPDGIIISNQGDGDLGARMARAAQRCIKQGNSILLIGTDCVEMSPTLLRTAAARLAKVDSVIHTTADGGYALMGLRKFHPLLFSDTAWGSNTVGGDTVDRIKQLGWSLFCAAVLHDVDEPQDLDHHAVSKNLL